MSLSVFCFVGGAGRGGVAPSRLALIGGPRQSSHAQSSILFLLSPCADLDWIEAGNEGVEEVFELTDGCRQSSQSQFASLVAFLSFTACSLVDACGWDLVGACLDGPGIED